MSKKFLFVGKDIKPYHRGAHTIGERFAREYFECIDYIEENDFPKEDWPERYNKVIFTYQAPMNYNIPDIKYILKSPDNAMFYIRNSLYASMLMERSICNGLCYYNSRRSHGNFIPYIPDYPYKVKSPDEITIGYYIRPEIVPDSFYYLTDLLMTSKTPINLVTFGDRSYKFIPELYTSMSSWKHTYDTEEFFNSITHYLYPKSAKKEDPWPNSLMEAIQANKQIIAPEIEGRYFTDGIDDLLSMLPNGYHHDLNHLDKIYDNKNHGLTRSTFANFYHSVFENNFENKLEYRKYEFFYDWVSAEI